MSTATFVKHLNSFTGDARLYRVEPPLAQETWDDDDEAAEYDHVVVSAVVAPYSGPETYIFGANAEGEVIDWCELPGSYRGGLDHNRALHGAGYEVPR